MRLCQVFFLAAVFWQTRAECQCGVFILGPNQSAENEVHLSSTFPQNCEKLEEDQVCRDFCFETFLNLTARGDLNTISPVFNVTGGEFFCNRLDKEIIEAELAGFYRWCQLSWKFVGTKASHKFCCNSTGDFIQCEEFLARELIGETSLELTTSILESAFQLEVTTDAHQRRDIIGTPIEERLESLTTEQELFDGKSVINDNDDQFQKATPLINDTDPQIDRRRIDNDDSFVLNATDGPLENNVGETYIKRGVKLEDSVISLITRREQEPITKNETFTEFHGQEQPEKIHRLVIEQNLITANETVANKSFDATIASE